MASSKSKPDQPQAVIFDCWNTLFYVKGAGSWMNRMGRVLFRHGFGYRYMKALERSLMVRTRPTPEAARTLLHDLHLPQWGPMDRRVQKMIDSPARQRLAYHDTFVVLNQLKKRGYKLGMITNTFAQAFEPLRQEFRLDEMFDVVVTSYESGLLKPDYRIFKLALDQLKTPPDQAVMVGDTLRDDVRGALDFGMVAYLIDRRERYPHYEPRIDELSDLLDILPK